MKYKALATPRSGWILQPAVMGFYNDPLGQRQHLFYDGVCVASLHSDGVIEIEEDTTYPHIED